MVEPQRSPNSQGYCRCYKDGGICSSTSNCSCVKYKDKCKESCKCSENTCKNRPHAPAEIAPPTSREGHEGDVMKRIEELKELCTNITIEFNEIRNRSKTQEVLISEQTLQLTNLKQDLELQRKKIKDSNTPDKDLNTKKELQTAIALINNMGKERKKLRNMIHDLKSNIRVFCRVRPRTPKETKQMKALCNISFIDDCTIEVGKSDGSDAMSCSGKPRKTKKFLFDKVFAPDASQVDVFEEFSPLV